MIRLFRDGLATNSGGPTMIPQEVKDKIWYHFGDTFGGALQIQAAEWTYETVALPELSAKDKRIKELEEALRPFANIGIDITDVHIRKDGMVMLKMDAGYFTDALAALNPLKQ